MALISSINGESLEIAVSLVCMDGNMSVLEGLFHEGRKSALALELLHCSEEASLRE